MSRIEYEADLKAHIRERNDALLELEAAGDDEKAASAAYEKIKAYSALIAKRKAAIAELPLLAPRLPYGTLNLGKWAYVFDQAGGKWISGVKPTPDLDRTAQLARGLTRIVDLTHYASGRRFH